MVASTARNAVACGCGAIMLLQQGWPAVFWRQQQSSSQSWQLEVSVAVMTVESVSRSHDSWKCQSTSKTDSSGSDPFGLIAVAAVRSKQKCWTASIDSSNQSSLNWVYLNQQTEPVCQFGVPSLDPVCSVTLYHNLVLKWQIMRPCRHQCHTTSLSKCPLSAT